MRTANEVSIVGGRSILRAQQKPCLRLHGVLCPQIAPFKFHLAIHPDGTIWMIDVVESSGSHSLGMLQFVRERFSVVMARMVHELRGTPCIGLEDVSVLN
jgi:hypothetical protein